MNVEEIHTFCQTLPHVTEDVKWGADLCFSIGGKMFCVTGLDGLFGTSFKVSDDEFEALTTTADIISAPYLGRYKWILISNKNRFTREQWEHYITQSYQLVKAKLPKGVLAKLS